MRVRVAISKPSVAPGVKRPGQFAVHVGHARTLYLGWQIAQQKKCPFDVRLDGMLDPQVDLSGFVGDVEACLRFLGIVPRKVYWHRQSLDEYRRAWMDDHFSQGEQDLLRYLQWDSATPLDVLAVLDDVEHAHSLMVRGMEFVDPLRFVGRAYQATGMKWYTGLEKVILQISKASFEEINVPLITMGGYKLSKEEGRVIHWSVLDMMGREQAWRFFDETAATGENWEWDQQVVAKYVGVAQAATATANEKARSERTAREH